MEELGTCPACGTSSHSFSQRLIIDECGHRKCRKCIIVEESSCSQCHIQGIPVSAVGVDRFRGSDFGSYRSNSVRSSAQHQTCSKKQVSKRRCGDNCSHGESIPTLASINSVISDQDLEERTRELLLKNPSPGGRSEGSTGSPFRRSTGGTPEKHLRPSVSDPNIPFSAPFLPVSAPTLPIHNRQTSPNLLTPAPPIRTSAQYISPLPASDPQPSVSTSTTSTTPLENQTKRFSVIVKSSAPKTGAPGPQVSSLQPAVGPYLHPASHPSLHPPLQPPQHHVHKNSQTNNREIAELSVDANGQIHDANDIRDLSGHNQDIVDHTTDISDYNRDLNGHIRGLSGHNHDIHTTDISDYNRDLNVHIRGLSGHNHDIVDHTIELGDYRDLKGHIRGLSGHNHDIVDHTIDLGDYNRDLKGHIRGLSGHNHDIGDHTRDIGENKVAYPNKQFEHLYETAGQHCEMGGKKYERDGLYFETAGHNSRMTGYKREIIEHREEEGPRNQDVRRPKVELLDDCNNEEGSEHTASFIESDLAEVKVRRLFDWVTGWAQSDIDKLKRMVGTSARTNNSIITGRMEQNQEIDAEEVIQRGKLVSRNFLAEIRNALDVNTSHALPNHLRLLDEEEGTFFCIRCNKEFSRNRLRHHLDCGTKPGFVCTLCSREFKTSSHLVYHTRSQHTGERPFKCQYCSKSFFQVVKLKRHILVHTGERPFSCDLCSKSFRTNYHLKEHRNIHTRDTHHQCDKCPKSFADSNNFRRHMKSMHGGGGRHICKISGCTRVFETKYEMKTHKLKAHGPVLPAPHQCNMCNRRFTKQRFLDRHKQTHREPQQEATCDVCQQRFPCEEDLHKHMERLHPDPRSAEDIDDPEALTEQQQYQQHHHQQQHHNNHQQQHQYHQQQQHQNHQQHQQHQQQHQHQHQQQHQQHHHQLQHHHQQQQPSQSQQQQQQPSQSIQQQQQHHRPQHEKKDAHYANTARPPPTDQPNLLSPADQQKPTAAENKDTSRDDTPLFSDYTIAAEPDPRPPPFCESNDRRPRPLFLLPSINQLDRRDRGEDRGHLHTLLMDLSLQEKRVLRKLFTTNRLETPPEFLAEDEPVPTTPAAHEPGDDSSAAVGQHRKKVLLTRYRNESGANDGENDGNEMDGSTMRMLNDATQMILSSGTVHIDMEKQQKEAFIKSMLKIIRGGTETMGPGAEDTAETNTGLEANSGF